MQDTSKVDRSLDVDGIDELSKREKQAVVAGYATYGDAHPIVTSPAPHCHWILPGVRTCLLPVPPHRHDD